MMSNRPGSEAFYTCDSNRPKPISISGLTGKNHKATRRGSEKSESIRMACWKNPQHSKMLIESTKWSDIGQFLLESVQGKVDRITANVTAKLIP
jgi:hypothetical protein